MILWRTYAGDVTVMYDTDVLIWLQRGHQKAAKLFECDIDKTISIFTYMELQQSARNKDQLKTIKSFIRDMDVQVLPLTPEIGHRASIYVEEYILAHALRAANAIIAATAIEHHLTLCTGNVKHFRPIKELSIKPFR